MTKIYRILGKRGRVTIPYAFRQQVGFGFNDVLSFTIQEDNSVLVRREKICDDCSGKGRACYIAGLPQQPDTGTATGGRAAFVCKMGQSWKCTAAEYGKLIGSV